MQAITNQVLVQALKNLGVIDEAELDAVYTLAESNQSSLQELLVDRGMISDENLGKVIADHAGLPFIKLSELKIDPNVVKILPVEFARRFQIIAYRLDGENLDLATSAPVHEMVIQNISKLVGCKVSLSYATMRDISEAWNLYKKELKQTFADLITLNKEAPISKIVDLIITNAFEKKASDIHLEPKKDGSLVRFRIDGVLQDVLSLSKIMHEQAIGVFKVRANLKTDEHLSAQDGKLQLNIQGTDLDVRVSIAPVIKGEKAVLRLLAVHARDFGLNDLGMTQENLDKVTAGFKHPSGMVLVTGPTGSGKTTTIYSILKILNTREKNIATIEDPVEYEIEGINQIQVNQQTNLTFASGLRSILRQDPNIIFVGEIRDEETAGIAVNSALTGHLVLSTLHTNDAVTTFARLADLKVKPFLIASTINCIVAQRLVRMICDNCKYSVELDRSELAKSFPNDYIEAHYSSDSSPTVFKGKGCPVCHNTGYKGRVALFEVLDVNEEIRELLKTGIDTKTIADQMIKSGHKSMIYDGLLKIRQGVTTIEEVITNIKE